MLYVFHVPVMVPWYITVVVIFDVIAESVNMPVSGSGIPGRAIN